MNWIEYVGIGATVLILISLTFSDTTKLRIFNTIGSVMFVIYGAYIGALSVWILNSVCAVVNIYKLLKNSKKFSKKFSKTP